ncbi:MAG TPA: glycosyltransferase family 1 protein [Smithellaceae bacterium]|mgnify:CR=1 FL=1|nr:glycosyltransferase family 1 protein [Smithellaceae bacterium]
MPFKKYKLAIDARPAQGRASGVVTYTRNLIRSLSAIADAFDFLFIVDDTKSLDDLFFPPGATFFKTPVGRRNFLRADLWTQWTLPRLLERLDVDVFHQPDYLIPCRPVPFVLLASYLDAIVFSKEDSRLLLSKKRVQWLMKCGAENADAIVTISAYSRTRLLEHLSMDPARLVSIWCGVAEEFFSPPDEKETKACLEKLDMTDPFILYYGGFSRRKNVPLLLEAMKNLATKHPCRLVIAGEAPSEIRFRIKQMGLQNNVSLFGYATETELRALLKQCRLFVFPSAMEGFGLPVAEAMASGAPVVCSANGSLPEIAGDAALLFKPSTPECLAAALYQGLTDNRLCAQLAEKGKQRAGLFDGSRAARDLGDLYLSLLDRKKAGARKATPF